MRQKTLWIRGERREEKMRQWLSVLVVVLVGVLLVEIYFLKLENESLCRENDFLRVFRYKQIPVVVTAYERISAHTDSTPTIGARGVRVNIGDVAISRKLERDGLLKLGQAVIYCGQGKIDKVIVNDRMGLPRKHIPRLKNYVIDVCVEVGASKKFGVKKGSLFIPVSPNFTRSPQKPPG